MTLGSSAGSYTYPYALTVLSRHAVFNGGVSSETSTQIRTRMIAATDKYSWPTIIWAGRNNFDDPTTVKADVAAMVAALGHTHYLVLGVDNRRDEPSGTDNYAAIVQLNADLATIYGAHFLDVRSYLVSQYDPNQAQDVLDHGNDVPPISLMADGELHMNAAGYAAVAALVYANRAQLGLN